MTPPSPMSQDSWHVAIFTGRVTSSPLMIWVMVGHLSGHDGLEDEWKDTQTKSLDKMQEIAGPPMKIRLTCKNDDRWDKNPKAKLSPDFIKRKDMT